MHAVGARIRSGLSNTRPALLKLPQRRDIERKIGGDEPHFNRLKRWEIASKRSFSLDLAFSRYQPVTSRFTWWASAQKGDATHKYAPLTLTPSILLFVSFKRY